MPHQIEEDIQLSDITFLETINEGKFSGIYKVEYKGRVCVLKVVSCDLSIHRTWPSAFNRTKKYHREAEEHHEWRETDIFKCESAAYQRLKETGLCDKGIVPDFYGVITDIQPEKWPELKVFKYDDYPPNAVLMEYIPGIERMHLGNFSKERMDKLKEYLAEINAVRVLHDDIHPRNMIVATYNGKERVLWIDFDRAQTYARDKPLTDYAQRVFALEPGYFGWWSAPPVR